jgi:predicted nucleotidyltransferase
MTAALDIQPEHAAIPLHVLRRHLPAGARAFVFGSRAHGAARPYSDLDLALEWIQPLGLALVGQIAEALSESDLPHQRADIQRRGRRVLASRFVCFDQHTPPSAEDRSSESFAAFSSSAFASTSSTLWPIYA